MEDQYSAAARAWRSAVQAQKRVTESSYLAAVNEPMPYGFHFTAQVIAAARQHGVAEQLTIEAGYDLDRLAIIARDWLEEQLAKIVRDQQDPLASNMLFLASDEVDWDDIADALLGMTEEIQEERWRTTGEHTKGSPFAFMQSWQLDPEKMEALKAKARKEHQ